MRAIKAVQQHYTPSPEILLMLDEFRRMMNTCIQIGLTENATSLKSLSVKAYKQLATYDAMSYYKLCAISGVTGILRNYRRTVRHGENPTAPHVRRLRLTTCYGFKIKDGCLLLPYHPGESIRIPLTPHVQATIRKYKVRSVTLTQDKLSLTYAKEVAEVRPSGFIGIDRNLNNVTLASTDGSSAKHELTEATRVKATYRLVRSRIRRNDVRILREITSKYGRKQQEKVKRILHNASKQIVEDAKGREFGIVMEKLTGIRKLYRHGNWQCRGYRGVMNGWSYFELQRQIEYKAQWEGIPVIYVNPSGTSVKCSMCGSRMARKPEESRQLKCPSCGFTVDRDVNAARNILARGVRFAPIALPVEAMVQESLVGNPESRWKRANELKPHEPTS
jgi:putative transposase